MSRGISYHYRSGVASHYSSAVVWKIPARLSTMEKLGLPEEKQRE
jgi:hypothetical protein